MFIHFVCFLGTANLKTIPFYFLRLFVPDLIILGVVKRSFKENSCSESLDKTEEAMSSAL